MTTQDRILTAAKDLLLEKGPTSLSVRSIAQFAGVNHGLIHHYFGSKEGMLAEMIKRETGFVLDRIKKRLTGIQTPASASEAFVEEIIVHPEFGKIFPQIIPLVLEYPSLKNTLAEVFQHRRQFLSERLGISNPSDILILQAGFLGLSLVSLIDESAKINEALARIFELFLNKKNQ